ncbi:hypothetical protein V1477_001507 [Vespula maculifrons]|uniref:Uncharacterized protein n=1 Tax=Vespula maculifrons TaxID=7453 RepID=A0ABD2CYP7_VESMC
MDLKLPKVLNLKFSAVESEDNQGLLFDAMISNHSNERGMNIVWLRTAKKLYVIPSVGVELAIREQVTGAVAIVLQYCKGVQLTYI